MATLTTTSLEQAHRLHRAGRLSQAESVYRRILREDSRQGDAHQGLAVLAYQQGDDAAAVGHARAAIAADPDVPAYYIHLGNVWRRMRRKTEAVAAYFRAAELDRENFEALYQLGSLLCELLRPDEGAGALRLAVTLQPNHAPAHLYLGLCLERLGQLDAAIEQYLITLRLQPENPRAYLMLGGALFKTGHVVEADLAFLRSLTLDPRQPSAHSRRIAALNYRCDLSARAVADAHREWDRMHGAPLWPEAAESSPPRQERDPARRLRVGYVSPNFFRHSVSHFLLPLLRAHDRSEFEVFCYAESSVVDETTTALMGAAEHWRTTHGEADETVAAQIRADGIDVLVDLAGHTGDNRLLVFARRPAPVQVSWLGYPQTTGMKAMDYRLSDAVVEPPSEADALSVEAIVRLPHGFHCFGRPGEDPAGDGCEGESLEIGPLPALANGFLTFGSFNTVQKMSPALVKAWAFILKHTPGSQLLLKSLPDDVIAAGFHALFAAEGIEPTRVEFLRWTGSRADHLRLYNRMDIALDPFPYNGTTTTCEALWMGVPVLTLRGDRHVSRVGASLLTRIELADWVADSEEAYVQQALWRTGDLLHLARLRAGLRERMRRSPLCNAPAFARDMEAAFRGMWQAVQA